MGGSRLQLPPMGLAEELLTFRRPVSVRCITRCSKHVGSGPQSLSLLCVPQLGVKDAPWCMTGGSAKRASMCTVQPGGGIGTSLDPPPTRQVQVGGQLSHSTDLAP